MRTKFEITIQGQISQKFVLILEITISNAEKFVKKFFIFGNLIKFTIQKQKSERLIWLRISIV